MSQPVQNLCNIRQFGPLRQGRTVDHQHRNAQRARSVQLGACTGAARVLGYHQLNAVPLHQLQVILDGERPARDDDVAIRQRQGARLIDQSQQIAVLRLDRKLLKMHPADSQKDLLRRAGQRRNRALDICDVVPLIADLRLPHGAGQGRQRHAGFMTGCDGVAAHLRGKWMGCIDHMRNRAALQVAGQTVNAAKPADPHRQGLRSWIFDTTGIGIGRRDALLGQSFGQRIGLGRATKNQEVGHA